MNKALLLALFRSLAIIICFAILFGLSTFFLFKTFLGGFLFAIVFQFLFGYMWNTFLERRDKQFSQTLLNNLKEAPVPTDLTCAYCNIKNRVPLLLSADNVFKCTGCNQTNTVYIQFTTTRITQPLSPNVALPDLPILEEDKEPKQRQTTLNEPIKIK